MRFHGVRRRTHRAICAHGRWRGRATTASESRIVRTCLDRPVRDSARTTAGESLVCHRAGRLVRLARPTQTVASWAGERPGRPSRGYQPAKSSSHHSPSSRPLTHIAVVPTGLLARATCAVRDGTCSPERGRSDNGHLDNDIGLRNNPTMPRGHAGTPGNSKITDGVPNPTVRRRR
jgi:hypothetical protein